LSPDSSDLKATALFEQAASNEYANFDPFATKILEERLFNKYAPYRIVFDRILTLALRYLGKEANEATVAEYLQRFEGKLNAFDVILGKQKFLAGDVRDSRSFRYQHR
jgi:glutathione S-transferase